jgi:hypothetical protein
MDTKDIFKNFWENLQTPILNQRLYLNLNPKTAKIHKDIRATVLN